MQPKGKHFDFTNLNWMNMEISYTISKFIGFFDSLVGVQKGRE